MSAAGCDRLFTDYTSGAATARPELERLLTAARADDTVALVGVGYE